MHWFWLIFGLFVLFRAGVHWERTGPRSLPFLASVSLAVAIISIHLQALYAARGAGETMHTQSFFAGAVLMVLVMWLLDTRKRTARQ